MPLISRPTSSRAGRRRPASPASGPVTGLALLCLAVAAQAEVSCHIHPPGSTPERPVGTIGPFAGVQACERERQRRFGNTGRCHCAADFSPRWVPPADLPPPGDSPLG